MDSAKMNMVHLITDLDIGGAEMVLLSFISQTSKSIRPVVISLCSKRNKLAEELLSYGTRIEYLGMDKNVVKGIWRFVCILRRIRPAVLKCWMYHANALSVMALLTFCRIRIIWGIHHSNLEARYNKRTTIWLARICGIISRWILPWIIYDSEAGKVVHERLGYNNQKSSVIPNGFDTERFRVDLKAKCELRSELGIAEEEILIGRIGRLDPLKGHKIFIEASAQVWAVARSARFLLCGKGIMNAEITEWIKALGMGEYFTRMEFYPQMNKLLNSLDLSVSPSISESFPVVVGESMSCGVPCVVTDVGDSAALVGDGGIVVTPGNAIALARGILAWIQLSKQQKTELAGRARERITGTYSVAAVVKGYERVLSCAL